MDANGLRFWMLADGSDWRAVEEPAAVYYDTARRSLKLASRSTRTLDLAPGNPEAAAATLELTPETRDAYGTRAYWDADAHQVMATGALPGATPIFTIAAGDQVTDLAMGADGVLYIALASGAIILQDRRNRWDPVSLSVAGFSAWRLAADPAGGVWALDRAHNQIGQLQGLPLPSRPYGPYAASTFRPAEENPHPPRLTVFGEQLWTPDERPAALACNPDGWLALLTWVNASGETRLRLRPPGGSFEPYTALAGAPFGFSIAWASDAEVAVLLANGPVNEAPVYRIDTQSAAGRPALGRTRVSGPIGDLYPLPGHTGGPFLHGLDLPPHYPTAHQMQATEPGLPNAGQPPQPPLVQPPDDSAPLYHLSLPSFAGGGSAHNAPEKVMDSGSVQTVWHRLYVEADIPPACGIRVFLAASDDPQVEIKPDDWHEHRFGRLFVADNDRRVPRAAWVSSPSEIAFNGGLLACPRVPDRSGLFTVLIERSNRPVRDLRGRYLRVRVELSGDGRSTPELAALRAYAPRFSYLNHYLPALYRETRFGPDADAPVPAGQPLAPTPADFLERFLDNFEGILTPLEDRIAAAYLVTDPLTAPDDALDWLGGWIGLTFDPAYPPARRRRMLREAPALYRSHGTLAGLQRALDIATDGGVARGEIVVLEAFRLRRAFATILGADLADENDPLLAGLSVSGNSFVGDTLFLGDETRQEFLALFGPQAVQNPSEAAAVTALFDGLAHRVTVLVHQETNTQDLDLIRRVVDLETPAHVLATVATASQRFMVGIASLVGVDTFLGQKPTPGPVRVDTSQLGVRDLVHHPPSLDPRLEGGRSAIASPGQAPMAAIAPPGEIILGRSFTLDASAAQAAPGRHIALYIWTMLD